MELRYILISVMIAITCGINAEENTINGVTLEANGMRAGDRLTRINTAFSHQLTSNTLDTWDFSVLQLKDDETVTNYNAFDENRVVENENNENRLYHIDSIGLHLTRHYRGGLDIKYQLWEKIHYPIMCGSVRQDKFFGEGRLGGLSYIKNAGFSSMSADKTGDMITPDGDTIPNVVRVRYHRSGTTHITNDFSSSFTATRDSALFSNDSIRHWLSSDSITHTIDKWQWYARGYRYPIMEMRKYKTYHYGVPSDSVLMSLYYPLEMQIAEIENDLINEYYRENGIEGYKLPAGQGFANGNNSRNTKNNGTGNNPGSIADSFGKTMAACNVSPTKVTESTTVTCILQEPAEVSTSLYGSNGILLWFQSESMTAGTHDVICPMNELPAGVYVINTVIGYSRFVHRIVKVIG
ncbi:MAG: hypothetical protein IJ328_02835 [Muribaculaceae bacterium]|nr:hypothetical protein [Muribaculaceae bacterium]